MFYSLFMSRSGPEIPVNHQATGDPVTTPNLSYEDHDLVTGYIYDYIA